MSTKSTSGLRLSFSTKLFNKLRLTFSLKPKFENIKNIFKKAVKLLPDILVVLVLLVSVITVISSAASSGSGVPSLFGYTFLSVRTDSMEPAIMTGDLIIGRVPESDAEYEVGDVVTYGLISSGTRVYNTHRITGVTETDGVRYYLTQGDNAPGQDEGSRTSGDIVSLWTGTRIGGLGSVMDFLHTGTGFFICLLLPVLLLFLYYLFRFIKNLNSYKQEQKAAGNIDESQKQRIIEEYLAGHGGSGTSLPAGSESESDGKAHDTAASGAQSAAETMETIAAVSQPADQAPAASASETQSAVEAAETASGQAVSPEHT